MSATPSPSVSELEAEEPRRASSSSVSPSLSVSSAQTKPRGKCIGRVAKHKWSGLHEASLWHAQVPDAVHVELEQSELAAHA